jgi:hypothetical protein
VDLVTYAVVASAAAGLSSEWTAIVRYRHFGFFTEVGFWLQELGMATCGLARLAAFYMMAEVSREIVWPSRPLNRGLTFLSG